jgi:hypothetical protein
MRSDLKKIENMKKLQNTKQFRILKNFEIIKFPNLNNFEIYLDLNKKIKIWTNSKFKQIFKNTN